MNHETILIECAKKYKLHHIYGMDLWMKSDDLLFIVQNHPISKGFMWRCSFTPLYSDELLWRISEIGGGSVETWEQFKKLGTSRRVNGVFVAPAKRFDFCTYQIPSSEEEIRALYESKIERFLEMVKGIKESDYETETEVSLINILRAIHEGDYKRAKKLTKRIHTLRKNILPEEQVLWSYEYWSIREPILKYLKWIEKTS